jgi:pilus assembly protein CpaE
VLSAIKVLLIEDNRLEARQTQQWLGAADDAFEIECVDQLQLGLERLSQGGIDIVLLDLNLPDSRGLETFTKLHKQSPQVPVVVLTGEFDDALGPAAMEQGAQDYLVKQQADAASLTRVVRFALARHRAQVALANKSQLCKSARVLGFVGAKGGVGTTTVALNIAVALAAQNQSVILAELQAGFGTLAHHLQHNAVANLSDILEFSADRIDVPALDKVLCRGPAGLRVLFGPQLDDPVKEIEAEQAAAIVHGLARMADFVIIDLSHLPTAGAQEAIAQCHFTVLVTEREHGSVICGTAMLHQLQARGVSGRLVGAAVVNRTIYSIPLEMSHIRLEFDCDIVGLVPCDANACLKAQESGVPIVLSAPHHDVSLCFLEITERIAAVNVMAHAS